MVRDPLLVKLFQFRVLPAEIIEFRLEFGRQLAFGYRRDVFPRQFKIEGDIGLLLTEALKRPLADLTQITGDIANNFLRVVGV